MQHVFRAYDGSAYVAIRFVCQVIQLILTKSEDVAKPLTQRERSG
jgi:hypothetical protein